MSNNHASMGDHTYYMQRAIALAEAAATVGEVPVGAVVVHDGVIVGEGANQRENNADPIAHAEMLALAEAAQKLGRWRLSGCTLYVTLEPCPMCAGAMVNSQLISWYSVRGTLRLVLRSLYFTSSMIQDSITG